MTCPFCEDANVIERKVVENDLAFAFPTNTPIVPMHMLVVPKRHAQYYDALTDDEKDAIEAIRKKLNLVLRNQFGAQGFNYAWNEEVIGGQSVPHFHLHVVPRKAGDAGIHQYEPRQFLYRPGSRPESSTEEMQQVVEALRAVL